MELIKFLGELKNNKYLTLNQLEYDIQKLKIMIDNPKIKFNYVKTKGLKNYINDLKSASIEGADTIRKSAQSAYSAVSKIMPNYKPKNDDDIYLLLGFLLSIDNLDDLHFDNEDEILALIGMLLINGSESELNDLNDNLNDNLNDIHLENKFVDPNQLNEELKKQISQLEQELLQSRDTISKQLNNSESKGQKISDLMSEISRIRKHTSERMSHFTNHVLNAKLRADIIEYKAALLDNESKKKDETYNNLLEDYRHYNEITQRKINENEARINTLDNELHEYQTRSIQLNSDLLAARQEADDARKAISKSIDTVENNELLNRAEKAEKDYAEAQEKDAMNEAKILLLQYHNAEARSTIDKHKHYIKSIESELDSVKQEHKNAMNAISTSEKTKKETEEYYRQIIYKYDIRIKEESDAAELNLNKSNEELKKVRSDLLDLDAKLKTSESEISNEKNMYAAALSAAEKRLETAEKALKEISKEKHNTNINLDKLHTELSQSQTAVQSIQGALEAITSRFEIVENEKTTLEMELHEAESRVQTAKEDAAAALKSKTDAESRTNAASKQYNMDIREIRVAMAAQIEAAKRDVKEAKHNEAESKKALEDANRAHTAAISEITTSLDNAESRISDLTNEFDELNTIYEKTIAQAIKDAERIKGLQNSQKNIQEENTQLGKDFEKLLLEYNKQIELNRSMLSCLEATEILYATTQKEFDKSKTDLETSQRIAQKLGENIATQTLSVIELNKKYEAKIQEHMNKNDEYRRKIETLKTQMKSNETKLIDLRELLGRKDIIESTQKELLSLTRQSFRQGNKPLREPLRARELTPTLGNLRGLAPRPSGLFISENNANPKLPIPPSPSTSSSLLPPPVLSPSSVSLPSPPVLSPSSKRRLSLNNPLP